MFSLVSLILSKGEGWGGGVDEYVLSSFQEGVHLMVATETGSAHSTRIVSCYSQVQLKPRSWSHTKQRSRPFNMLLYKQSVQFYIVTNIT